MLAQVGLLTFRKERGISAAFRKNLETQHELRRQAPDPCVVLFRSSHRCRAGRLARLLDATEILSGALQLR